MLQADHFSFCYPGADTPTLRDCTFQINDSDFLLLCGESGCGKTTLLRSLKPELAPEGERRGALLFDGVSLGDLDKRTSASQIGFVFQDPEAQIVTDKVWHELAFGLESLGVPPTQMRRRVAEMAEFFGISHWFHKQTSALSGGQKQLLNLASVLAMRPTLLLLDEPTAQLDPIAADNFLTILEKINRELGIGVLLCEHRLERVFSMVDRVMLLQDGAIRVDAPPRQAARELSGGRMVSGLPSALRIASALGESAPPLTVREGRLWLEKKAAVQTVPAAVESPVPAPPFALEAAGCWFAYGDSPVLRGCSLRVPSGSIYALLGGNGAGKSTLLRLLAGVEKPAKGRTSVLGQSPKKQLRQHVCALLPQNPKTLFTEPTVEEELFVMPKGKQRADDLLNWLGLQQRRKLHPYDLSGGEQGRLALGKLLLLHPQLLFLDEPTRGLDPQWKQQLGQLLRQLAQQGKTVVLVSHDIEFCARTADWCGLLFDGEIVSEASARGFFAGNAFYTTAASRMSRRVFADAVTEEDVIAACRRRGING